MTTIAQPPHQSQPPGSTNGLPERPRQLTDTLDAALALYDLGLNVFPLPYGQKHGTPWKPLQYTRLPRSGLNWAFRGQCNIGVICGRTSGNLFVIDCETPESFEDQIRQAEERGIPLFTVKTARGGHIWLRCVEGEVKNLALGDVEIRGRRRYVLAPPSLHPDGVLYEYHLLEADAPPQVSIEKIDWLLDTEGNPLRLKVHKTRQGRSSSAQRAARIADRLNLDERTYKLSNKTLDYLENGHTLAKGTRNRRLFAAACDLSGCGFSQVEALKHLDPIARASGLEEHEIHATMQSSFSKRRLPARPQTHTSCAPRPLDWRYAQAYVETADWPGRTGGTDRMIALALVERARLGSDQDGSFRASYRELGQIGRRTNRMTIGKSLQRLEERGFIEQAGQDAMSGASRWRITETVLQQGQEILESCESEPLQISILVCYTSGSYSQDSELRPTDAAERGALGAEGLMVCWMMLQAEVPLPTKEIARRTHLTPGQAYYRLRKLREFGLVALKGKKWMVTRAVSSEELDEIVARPAGKLGKGRTRQQRFAEERQWGVLDRIVKWRADQDPGF